MNIFVLDQDPVLAAKYHCDKHVGKMISESMQMLKVYANTVLDKPLFFTSKGKPVKGYANHPCTTWIFESKAHFDWLVDLTNALNTEWRIRYNHNKDHKSIKDLGYLVNVCYEKNGWDTSDFLGWATALPDSLYPHTRIVNTDHAVQLYRMYYAQHKTHFAAWAFLDIPDWWPYQQFPAGMAFCKLNKNYFNQKDQIDLFNEIDSAQNQETYELAESFKKKRKKKTPKPPTLVEKVRNHIKSRLTKRIPNKSTIQKWVDKHGKNYPKLIEIADDYILKQDYEYRK